MLNTNSKSVQRVAALEKVDVIVFSVEVLLYMDIENKLKM